MSNEFNFDLVKGYCTRFLIPDLRNKHLEDLIQHVALRYFENGNSGNLEWYCLHYCRENGIGKYARKGSIALEVATYVGLQEDENEDSKENGFLFDRAAAQQHEDRKDPLTTEGIMEEFLEPLGLETETLKWVLKTYQPSNRRIR